MTDVAEQIRLETLRQIDAGLRELDEARGRLLALRKQNERSVTVEVGRLPDEPPRSNTALFLEILREAGEPLKVAEIWKRAQERGAVINSNNPHNVVRSTLRDLSKAKQAKVAMVDGGFGYVLGPTIRFGDYIKQ